MTDLPGYIGLLFIGVVVATVSFLYFILDHATKRKEGKTRSFIITAILIADIILISILAMKGFFLDFQSMPPKLFLFVIPMVLAILVVLAIPNVRAFLIAMPIASLTYIHIIRIPVEIVLWWLFKHGAVPEAMTFEGINYDILTGITAPFAAIFLVGQKINHRVGAIIWNFAGLILLFNVVIRAIMATPYFYDATLFETPNAAVFYFPFVLLPTFVVPAVLFCHLVSLVKLFAKDEED